MSLNIALTCKKNINRFESYSSIKTTSTMIKDDKIKEIDTILKQAQMSLNGMIIRETAIIQLLDSINPLHKTNQLKKNSEFYQRSPLPFLLVKISIIKDAKQSLCIYIPQYKQQFTFATQFAFVQRQIIYLGSKYLKVCVKLSKRNQELKFLISNNKYSQLRSLLQQNQVRSYVYPNPQIQELFYSSPIHLSQLPKLQPSFIHNNGQLLGIQKIISCNFNEKINCFAVFLSDNILIFEQNNFLTILKTCQFSRYKYWMQSKYDYISFEGMDHIAVFQQKFEEVHQKHILLEKQKQLLKQRQILEQIKPNDMIDHEEYTNRKGNNFNVSCAVGATLERTQIVNSCLSLSNDIELNEQQEQYKNQQRDEIKIAKRLFHEEIQQIPHQIQKVQQNIGQYSQTIMFDQKQQEGIIIQSLQLKQQLLIKQQKTPTRQLFESSTEKKSIFDEQYFSRSTGWLASSQNDESKQNSLNFENIAAENYLKQQIFNNKASLLYRTLTKRKQATLMYSETIPKQQPKMGQIEKKLKRVDQIAQSRQVMQISQDRLVSVSSNNIIKLYQRANNCFNQQVIDSSIIFNPWKIYKSKEEDSMLLCDTDQRFYYCNMIDFSKNQIEVEKNRIKDALSINRNTHLFLEQNKLSIVDLRINSSQQNIYFSFSNTQNFAKIDYIQNKAVVGCQNGLVKIYDLRTLNKKSINNFNLNTLSTPKLIQKQFVSLSIMPNHDISCQYGSSAYMIDSNNGGNKDIFSNSIRKKQRSDIVQYYIHPKIISSIDNYSKTPSSVPKFNFNFNKKSMTALYKNFQFHFNQNRQRPIWNKIDHKHESQCIYLAFNQFSQNDELIYGFSGNQNVNFQIRHA